MIGEVACAASGASSRRTRSPGALPGLAIADSSAGAGTGAAEAPSLHPSTPVWQCCSCVRSRGLWVWGAVATIAVAVWSVASKKPAA